MNLNETMVREYHAKIKEHANALMMAKQYGDAERMWRKKADEMNHDALVARTKMWDHFNETLDSYE